MSAEKYVLRLLTSALEHEVAVPDREAESFVDKCVGPTVVTEAGAEETGLVQRARTLDEDVARSGPRTATVVIATPESMSGDEMNVDVSCPAVC